ncbi:Dimodular nonribosomal peptide synthase [Legionella massiliensis]|uniref:Dimodular nonribosomal peptide synthase n=1 Tax=Legionella massiliensis TaxID=1034943 RepID=A0A078KTE3_9GAMM|nr:amino acid adenylation domain-containing protein [Legionella massiliensis]CDZ77750.1 Dimodular nonribosomal peptide synthase [Legionella massiliensis]CEE13488.1 Dimodular nonribosomal peptide synthase [Legionella massiliensis]
MEIEVCLIGDDSLVIQCGNLLLKRHHRIRLVISSLDNVKEWATDHGFPWISSIEKLESIESFQVDYLFSIVNGRVLSEPIRQLARYYAINYHDSYLPKFAGLNSTSWALVQNEKEHGVTWHVMNDSIDEGEIIFQKKVPIYPNDTALTLNLRCYEYAISSFEELLKLIEARLVSPSRQNLENRSYFAANHHLPCFGYIDWRLFSAKTIERISRALTLGRYSNYVGTLKLLVADDYVIVSQAKLTDDFKGNDESLGKILAIEKDALVVSTLSQPIRFTCLLSKAGLMLEIEEWANSLNLKVGDNLPFYEVKEFEAQRKYHDTALGHERYWIKKIKAITEHSTFTYKNINKDKAFVRFDKPIQINALFPNKVFLNKTEMLLTAVFIYLLRLNQYERVTVALVHPEYKYLNSQFGSLFSTFIPLSFYKKGDFSFQDALDLTTKALMEVDKRPVFLSDITARHPELVGNTIDLQICINLAGDKDYCCQDNTVLYFNIDPLVGEVEISHRLYGAQLEALLLNATQHLMNILIQLVSYPYASVQKYCFLTQTERRTLIRDWGKGKFRYLSGQSLETLFEAQLAENSNKIAIYSANEETSYFQLNEMAEQIANELERQGVAQQSLIGLYLLRGVEMIAVILGILKAHCAYVPLDPKYPALRIEQIVEDSNLEYIFIQKNYWEDLSGFFAKQGKAIHLLEVEAILAQDLPQSRRPRPKLDIADKLAYVMFTSGTTGRAKGVMVTHKNIINYCKWFTETTHFDENCRIDFSSSIAFDLSIPCTLAPLLVGGALVIASNAQKTNPQHFLNHLKQHDVTHVELTPGYLEMLLHYPEDVVDLKTLHYVLLGADAVPTVDVMKWLSLCPDHQIINEYGSTETTVSVTSYFVIQDELVEESSVPIGRPGFNSTCYVLDQFKSLCPVGVKGELYVGGAQVSRGYINRAELTQDKFIKANFSQINEILYRTGDIVCWLPGGDLQFFGRNDHQVKIQGYRIELPAIEATLAKMPGILQAVVVVMKNRLKVSYLRAYLVTDKQERTTKDLSDYLGQYLPRYMIPSEFFLIKFIPLKENEKIDFAALERQNYQLLQLDELATNSDLNSYEVVVTRLWQQVFHSVIHSIHDDFFAMGGDSLMALQLISSLKEHYAVNLPLQLVFEYPTIASLALRIEQILSTKDIHVQITYPNLLVKLAEGGEKIPLFLVHPVGGSVFWYKQLASYLQGKYTVYGIQDLNVDGVTHQFKTLEDMAGFYLQEIKKVYKGDNYCLGGASFGATVAFEMAKQLIHDNKAIQFLGLFDGWAHYPSHILYDDTRLLLSKAEANEQLLNPEIKQSLSKLEKYRKELLTDYKLSGLQVNATLFKANEIWPSFKAIDDAHNGWQPYIEGNLLRCNVPGNHETMFFEPNVQVLASQLFL